MASIGKKRLKELSDDQVGEVLFESDSEESVLSSDSDSENDINDRSEVDALVYYELDEVEDKISDFAWKDISYYKGKREKFVGDFGPQAEANNAQNIVDIFEIFFNENLVRKIAEETNRYAEQISKTSNRTFSLKSRIASWEPVDFQDIYIVLGLFMLMGIVQKPTLRSYFSTKRVISTPGFGDIITRDRFESICKFLHFANNEEKSSFQGPKKLYKIYSVIDHLNRKFQEFFLPSRNISIDESLTLWKGRLSFKQYIPLKASKFGIKTYELCDLASGYLWSFLVYTGKDTNFSSSLINQGSSKTTSIVLKLAEPLLNQGRTIWMDNYYNSPDLAKLLKVSYKTDCVGTLRLGRKNVPKLVKEKKLKKGEVIGMHSGPVSVIKWQDKKSVTMISTFHDAETEIINKRGKEMKKPICVVDYNKQMGGVDQKEQLLQAYLIERKRVNKWYMKIFRRLIHITVLNTMIIYRENSGKRIDHLSFRVQLVESLFLKYGSIAQQRVPGRHTSDNMLLRLTERHFIKRIPPKGIKARPQRRCAVCTKHGKRKETVYWCEPCDTGLCLDCFEDYHTKRNF